MTYLPTSARICLVTSGHIASDPRLVKSADALASAGYDVSVVAIDLLPAVHELDGAVLQRAAWTSVFARRGSTAAWAVRTAKEHLCRRLWRAGLRVRWMAEMAFGRTQAELARLAVAANADLYIGHNLVGLVAAGLATRANGALLAFDAEDDHPGEIDDSPGDAAEFERRMLIMNYWMPKCCFRTAAAPMMAETLRARFGLEFTSILNVFPLSDAPAHQQSAQNATPRIYWFSQTIGGGRGLEQLIAILARCRTPFQLELRGSVSTEYRQQLKTLALREGLPGSRLAFLESAEPDKMSLLAAGYALGASVELALGDNRRACLGNKIFQYLLAGTPVLLSDTPAQTRLAAELADAALLISLVAPAESAAALDQWFADSGRRERAAAQAWQLAQTRFNWECEQKILLEKVRTALAAQGQKRCEPPAE